MPVQPEKLADKPLAEHKAGTPIPAHMLDVNFGDIFIARYAGRKGDLSMKNFYGVGLYSLNITNATHDNLTLKEVLLSYRLNEQEHMTDSIVLNTEAISAPGETIKRDSLRINGGPDELVVNGWDNLRVVLLKKMLLLPGATLTGSAYFLLSTKDQADLSKITNIKLVIRDFLDHESEHPISLSYTAISAGSRISVDN